jgi:hypothetical protein
MRYIGLSAALVIAAFSGPARASSFEVSEFDARMALISDARDLEIKCAGLAVVQAKRRQSLSMAQAGMLFEEVAQRLGSDLGSEVHGMIQAGRAGLHWSDATIPAASLAKERATLLHQCDPILRAARAGTLEKVLEPPSPAPLRLPDLETCLTYAATARKRLDDPRLRQLAERFEQAAQSRSVGPGEAARQPRDDQKLPAEYTKLSSQKLEAYLGWACLPALAAKARPNP